MRFTVTFNEPDPRFQTTHFEGDSRFEIDDRNLILRVWRGSTEAIFAPGYWTSVSVTSDEAEASEARDECK